MLPFAGVVYEGKCYANFVLKSQWLGVYTSQGLTAEEEVRVARSATTIF